MKIEQLLVQYFYKQKTVSLEGLGILSLSPEVIFPSDSEKAIDIPSNAIRFTYDERAKEDEGLVNFIVQQTRKIKPLAASDLGSYFALGKQFLNLGKPFIIEGIGTLNKNQMGNFEFIPGHYVPQKPEAIPTLLKEKPEGDISFASPEKEKGNKKGLYIALVIFILVIGGLAAWYFLIKKDNNTDTDRPVTEKPVIPLTDTTSPVTKPPVISRPPVNNGGYTFKIVFEETIDKAEAEDDLQKWVKRGHHVIIYTSDSLIYKLAEPFSRPLTDTAKIRDSLHRYYYRGKTSVELY